MTVSPNIPTLAVVGGFLGAGKTTALLALAERLAGGGLRVGLITNDQGDRLVDAALVTARGWAGAAVTGGCFCCRFHDLLEAVQELQREVAPDVLLAEPVGSCTDLAATVLRPLQRLHGAHMRVAPFSVLVDPLLLHQHLPGRARFPADVTYLFERQLAEADLIVVTKADLVEPAGRAAALDLLALARPGVRRLEISSRRGDGLDAWLDALLAPGAAGRTPLDLDYGRYAAAEAALGWLNASAILTAATPFALDRWVEALLAHLGSELAGGGASVAHLKAQVESSSGAAKASLVQAGGPITWDLRGGVPARGARALINARAVCPPDQLEAALHRALAAAEERTSATATLTGLQAFSPARPEPTYRDA